MRHFLLAAAMLCPVTLYSQQQDSTSPATLKPVVVTVTRGSGRSVLASPYAITIAEPDSARPGQRHASIDETLALIPGVTTVSRNNPAQDPRLSIRGFGARSAFGVRGIRVLRDGMPITLPDGQTPLDYVSLESVGQVEVLRGAASALYGNASGGVVDLRTVVPQSSLAIDAKQWLASSATARSTLIAAARNERSSFNADVTHSSTDGERAHSAQRATIGFLRGETRIGSTRVGLSVMGLVNPLSENPGALTLDELKSDREQADAASLRRNARKAVNQFQLGLSAARDVAGTALSFAAYGGARTLDNPLTFAVVEVGRHTWGANGMARRRIKKTSLAAGFDLQWQNDLRRNFGVCADTIRSATPTAACPDPQSDRGIVALDQRELVSSAGAFISGDVDFTNRLTGSLAARADRIRFEVRDRLVSGANPDDSGERTLAAVSPVVGLVFRATQTQSIYGNVSTAFETPTATELGNHEDGTAGINQDLDPQKSLTVEVGAKGWINQLMRYDAALFSTRVRDELVPFEIPSSNGRRFFRNAGRTRRDGAEIGVQAARGPVSLMTAYTYSRFKFVDYASGGTDLGGNVIPGIPPHRVQSALRLGSSNWFSVLENETAGRTWTDDANTFHAPGYSVTHVRGGAGIGRGLFRGTVTAGIQNVFDRTYASSIVVNAARAKYFEPAAGRIYFLGLTIGVDAGRWDDK